MRDEEHPDEPQNNLMNSRPGEEDEEVIFEIRGKALKLMGEGEAASKKLAAGYNTVGLGPMRVLKNSTTGRTRMVMRAEPGANVIINTVLSPSMNYFNASQKASGAVKFGILTGKEVEHWVMKVKNAQMAEELSGVLEANKK